MRYFRRYIVVSTLALLTLAGGIFIDGTGVTATPKIPLLAEYTSTRETGPMHEGAAGLAPASHTARMSIPAIDVDAGVQSVGISFRGNMSVPDNYTDVGWYRLGPAPGEPGNAVFAGHVDNGYWRAGVFKKLAEVRAGDLVHYEANGRRHSFVVRSVESHPYESPPAARIWRSDGPPGMVLITCGGPWLEARQTYAERVIIFADAVEVG